MTMALPPPLWPPRGSRGSRGGGVPVHLSAPDVWRPLEGTLRNDSNVELSQYRDPPFRGDHEEQEKLLKKSCTLYAGNLSFCTTEGHTYELFSKSGGIKKIMMGPDVGSALGSPIQEQMQKMP